MPIRLDTLATLRERGYRLAILSNWDRRLRGILDGLGISPFFEELIISSEIGFEKPDARIFETAQKRMGVSGGKILHVGDSPYHDLEGCRPMGWHCLLVEHGADAIHEGRVRTLQEILKILP